MSQVLARGLGISTPYSSDCRASVIQLHPLKDAIGMQRESVGVLNWVLC